MEDWRNFRITRIAPYRNRLVGSLSIDELKNLNANWMAWARDFPGLLTSDDLALYRALEQAFIHHCLEATPLISKRKEDTPVVKQESSASPQQSLKLPIPPAPLSPRSRAISEISSQPPPAPIARSIGVKHAISEPIATLPPSTAEQLDDRREER